MTPLYITNSLSGEKEEFKSIQPGVVGMYVCGPTVYGPLHAGHARTMVAFDVIRNYIEHFRDEVERVIFIQNITDVGHLVGDADEGEDKIQKKAQLDQKHPMQIVDEYIKNMWEGMDSLLCDRPTIAPRATGHIPEIIDAVKKLLDMGYAYEVEGSIYFDTSKFDDYLNLSGNSMESLERDVRIQSRDSKRNPADFALWKKAETNHIMQWTSPWGMGYPGWHIECSVMSQKYLGNTIDIHGGARELKFPHHENEIAQSECLSGQKAVNYWMHTGLLTIDGVKMAKSLGNFITVEEMVAKYGAEATRYFIVSNHYSSEVDFKESSIESARNSIKNINNYIFRVLNNAQGSYNPNFANLFEDFRKNFEAAMNDDFGTPQALASLFMFINKTNLIVDEMNFNEQNRDELITYLRRVNLIFKFLKFDRTTSIGSVTSDQALIQEMVNMRDMARKDKNFTLADTIRDLLKKAGVELLDQPAGRQTLWRKI